MRLRLRGATAALVAGVVAALLWVGSRGGRDRMVRDQLFFASDPTAPSLLAAFVFQRVQEDGRTALEVKAFSAREGRWETPFYERVDVATWPGDGLEAAFSAWRAARTGRPISWTWEEPGRMELRTGGLGLTLQAERLSEGGSTEDPHGTARYTVGPGTVEVNGRRVPGTVVREQLVGRPRVRFGHFEMWWLRRPHGVALGRHQGGNGMLLRWPGGATPWSVIPSGERRDPQTGFDLPDKWRVDGVDCARVDGEAGHGTAPDGLPAVYDVALAVGAQTEALVFHLQDTAGR